MKKHELIINGIYVLKNRKNTYLIILEETKNKIYQTYILESYIFLEHIINPIPVNKILTNIANIKSLHFFYCIILKF